MRANSGAIVGARGQQFALTVLRLVIGFGFVAHGWAKLSRGPVSFAALLENVGIPVPQVMAWAVIAVEILGGALLMLGVVVALVSIPLLAVHIVAIFTVHLRHGFSSVNTVGLSPDGPVFGPPGFEINLLYIASILVVAAFGPGAASLQGSTPRRE